MFMAAEFQMNYFQNYFELNHSKITHYSYNITCMMVEIYMIGIK